MHRVVFGKSMTFRWFADIEPQDGSVAIKIQKSRKEQPQIINVKLEESLENLKESLKNAYETIH